MGRQVDRGTEKMERLVYAVIGSTLSLLLPSFLFSGLVDLR